MNAEPKFHEELEVFKKLNALVSLTWNLTIRLRDLCEANFFNFFFNLLVQTKFSFNVQSTFSSLAGHDVLVTVSRERSAQFIPDLQSQEIEHIMAIFWERYGKSSIKRSCVLLFKVCITLNYIFVKVSAHCETEMIEGITEASFNKLQVEKSDWNEEFTVTMQFCANMLRNERPFTRLLKLKQRPDIYSQSYYEELEDKRYFADSLTIINNIESFAKKPWLKPVVVQLVKIVLIIACRIIVKWCVFHSRIFI